MGTLLCESEMVENGCTVGGEQNLLTQAYGIPYKKITTNIKCPDCDQRRALGSLIIHLNDVHRYTFRKIAAVLKRKGF